MSLEDINPNRGLTQKPLPDGGPLISMCKTKPGIYFNANGEVVSDETAASAGFDVVSQKRLKAKSEALAEATGRIEKQFAEEKTKLDGMTDAELEEKGLAEPGSLVDPEAKKAEPSDVPFVTKTANGEPRVARTRLGGPVKVMEYSASSPQGWKVFERESGKVLDDALDKDDASELLLAE